MSANPVAVVFVGWSIAVSAFTLVVVGGGFIVRRIKGEKS